MKRKSAKVLFPAVLPNCPSKILKFPFLYRAGHQANVEWMSERRSAYLIGEEHNTDVEAKKKVIENERTHIIQLLFNTEDLWARERNNLQDIELDLRKALIY